MARSLVRTGLGSADYSGRSSTLRSGAMARPFDRAANPGRRPASGRLAATSLRILAGATIVAAAVLLIPGLVLDSPQPAPQPADAIVVISGDEQMARFQEGMTLYQGGYGKYLVFSGAAFDNGVSNADVMHDLAVQRGVPDSVILEEPLGEDTWGNAVFTRKVLEDHGLRSAILVTSPYHARRAKLTFDTAYAGSGISLMVHSAFDSEWRKLSWWRRAETRRLTFTELQKLAYIFATGQFH